MSQVEWKEYNLYDICEVFDKKRIPLSSQERGGRKGDYRYYGAQGVIDYVNGYIFDGEYILLAEDGDNLKSRKQSLVQKVSGKFWVNNHAHILSGNGVCATDFLYYLLSGFDFAPYITGSAQPKLSQQSLAKIFVKIPPLTEQKRIAGILSSLDDKIELNNKINDNLEKQAQALFKNYEECVPYCELKISDVAEINPDSYGSKDIWEYVNYLDTSSISQNVVSELQYIDLAVEKLPSRAKRKVIENDIVYSTVRPNQLHYGIISDVKPNMLVSTGFAVLRSKNVLVSNEYLYLSLTQEDTIEKLQQIAEQSTSTFPAIKPSDIGDCSIKVFKQKDAELLNRQLSAVFKKIMSNNQENQRLTTLRDTLLPKLMSGEN